MEWNAVVCTSVCIKPHLQQDCAVASPSNAGQLKKSSRTIRYNRPFQAAKKERAMQQQFDVFVASLTTFWTQLPGFVPQLLAALLLLFVGWLLANLARPGGTKRP